MHFLSAQVFALLLGASAQALIAPRDSFQAVLKDLDTVDDGILEVALNGTLFSLDADNIILETIQLSEDEFADITGCVLVSASNPSPVQPDGCTLTDGGAAAAAAVSEVKRDGSIFERQGLKCAAFVCRSSAVCSGLTIVTCTACLRIIGAALGVCR